MQQRSLCVLFLLLSLLQLVVSQDPDIYRNVTELITSKGYPCEQHFATTPDGFILSIQRIPNGASNSQQNTTSKPVVFLLHGFLDAATTWVIDNPDESLGFILADAGYDVWLGNTRGNIYSRQNTHLDPSDPSFWEWSIDEMAKYDLPTFYDYILGVTQVDKLTHIGHSQGTAQAFAAFSSNQALSNQVDLFIALAPVAYLAHQGSLLITTLKDVPEAIIHLTFGRKSFPASNNIVTELEKFFPGICTNFPLVCENVIFLAGGCNFLGKCDFGSLNQTRLPVYASHIGGVSVQDAIQWLQIAKSDSFPMFDYGVVENLIKYNQTTPPVYDLTQVNVPVALFSGGEDNLGDPQDVETLQSLLPNIVFDHFEPLFEHLDFVWGLQANTAIYSRVLTLLQKYKNM